MKKLSIIILAALLVALCFALSACGHEHSFGEWETVSAPSCTNAGYQQRVCDCGERELPLWAAIKLADYYNITLDYLVGRNSE